MTVERWELQYQAHLRDMQANALPQPMQLQNPYLQPPQAGQILQQMQRIAENPFVSLLAYEQAKAKSKVLLKEWLSPDQLADYTSNGYFWVEGQITKHKYLIRDHNSFNITRYIDDKPHSRLCFYPDGSYGLTGDVMLAQKLALENYEGIALCRANQGPA